MEVRPSWHRSVVRECQVFAWRAMLLIGWEELESLAAEFVTAIPEPANAVENWHLHGLLHEVASNWGTLLHRRLHGSESPANCGFDTRRLLASFRREPHVPAKTAFLNWASAFSVACWQAHPVSPIWQRWMKWRVAICWLTWLPSLAPRTSCSERSTDDQRQHPRSLRPRSRQVPRGPEAVRGDGGIGDGNARGPGRSSRQCRATSAHARRAPARGVATTGSRLSRMGFSALFACAVPLAVQLVGLYLVFATLVVPALCTSATGRRSADPCATAGC